MRDRLVLHMAACATVVAILAPLVMPGYVLSYDMVFVPSQPLVPELIAPVDELPRAVPLDAIVSLVSQVAPGWLLQRLALVAIVWAAVVGAGRLVPARSVAIRVVAGIAYAWTPFLAERLLIGQWALLVAYACLPWLVMACRDLRDGKPQALGRLIVAAGLSALTPTGGLLAATVALVMLAGTRASPSVLAKAFASAADSASLRRPTGISTVSQAVSAATGFLNVTSNSLPSA
jgi:hypothetical protein